MTLIRAKKYVEGSSLLVVKDKKFSFRFLLVLAAADTLQLLRK